MTTAAIDLGGTCLRVACPGPGGLAVVLAADGTSAVPARVWLAGPGDARAGELAAGGPPEEVITTVRADLLADPRSGARERYYHGRYEPPITVAGYLLRDAAGRAASASGSDVSAIVVGVPAAADDLAPLRRAATAAGLTVAGAIAEPVAVALHYGAVADGVDHALVVADAGGSTVDIAVLRIVGRDVTVLGAVRRPAADAASLPDLVTDLVSEEIAAAGRASGGRPDTVLLAGGSPALSAVGDALAGRLGLQARMSQPELAVLRGLMLSADFGLLYVTGLGGEPLSPPPPPLTRSPRAALPVSADPLPAATSPAAGAAEPVSDPLPAARPGRAEPATAAGDAVPEPPRRARPARPAPPAPPPPPRPPASPSPAPAGADPGGRAAGAPGDVPASGAPEAGPLTGRPVERLKALRRGAELLLTWDWPAGSAEAVVRWHSDDDRPGRHGSARCSWRRYMHDGGFEIRAGLPGVTVTVEALGYGPQFDGMPPSAVRVEPALPAVTYDPHVRGRRKWTATVTFTSQIDCELPPVLAVLGTGGYKPESTRDGEVVRVIPAQPLRAGQAAVATFELPRRDGICWLVCLPADDDTVTPVDLRPAALHRLRVRG